jgi:hypothetical protein
MAGPTEDGGALVDYYAKMEVSRRIASLGGQGILTAADLDELNDAKLRVLQLMSDGRWHSREQIEEISGQLEGMRRMRELRSMGFTVDRRRLEGQRAWEYRLSVPPQAEDNGGGQADLFGNKVRA